MFPLKIDHSLHLRLLETGRAYRLFQLVDSNRDHLRLWLPFVDDHRSVAAAIQFITRNRDRNNGRTRLALGIWTGESLAGVATYDH